MNQRMTMPSLSSMANDHNQFASLFLTREDCLILMAQLNQLIKAVQRHRGTSMGLLAGNSAFLQEFEALQHQVERRLATLEAFAMKNRLLSDRDKESLSLAWATIRSDWEYDRLNDNFELHSHFIQQLLTMVYNLGKQLEVPMIIPVISEETGLENTGAFSRARMAQQIDILAFVAKSLPETIEHLAKIRGLATYATAADSLEGVDERKLRYWVVQAREQNIVIQDWAENLNAALAGSFSSLVQIKQRELLLLQFLNMVEQAVFEGHRSREDAHKLFNMATDIMEGFWTVVAEGLEIIRQWHQQDLEAWIKL